ncbi:MAG TPA: EamA family transporter [Rhodanobacteraceae bacterium]|nr:EamA family transporter [Rhodanobacteraceae bacterium]
MKFGGIPLTSRAAIRTESIPPHAFFLVSAVFHYLGPAFAVLLFQYVGALGVAWLRISTAALAFAIWRRPWRILSKATVPQLRLLIAMGAILAAMNSVFYLAIDRLPLGTVGAIEFLAPIALAVAGLRDARNVAALAIAIAGVALLTDVRFVGDPLAYVFAFANCALFAGYIVAGHALARDGGASGIDRLGAAMLIAAIAAAPVGFHDALTAFRDTRLLLAAIGVGICSSVIPYVCDQLAMARLPRSTFALLLALLPAMASIIGALVLHQIPGPIEIAGIALVIGGVLLHRTSRAG